MDGQHFDNLARRLSLPGSRRAALGGLLAGLLLPLETIARTRGKNTKRKSHGKGKGKERQRTSAQAETCWRAGACIPKKGANVSQGNLAGSTAFQNLNCTGCNVSRANLNGINAQGANFTRANLSGSCLIGADFTGATFANSTNLSNATFCNTIMPDGSVNNSGCESAPACCASCLDVGAACGPTIAGSCCGASQCINGACTACATCTICETTCPSTCRGCIALADGTLACRDNGYTNCLPCTSNADCADGSEFNLCYTGFIRRGATTVFTAAANCENPTITGACVDLSEFQCEPGAQPPPVERAMPARGNGGVLIAS